MLTGITADKTGFFCSVMRKEFQRTDAWKKFRCSDKIYWGEGK